MKPTNKMIEKAAEAIADVRRERQGRPPISTIGVLPFDYRTQLMQEAEAALCAALDVDPWAEFKIAPSSGPTTPPPGIT